MIAKIITGTNAYGLLQYLTTKKNEVITSNKLFPNLTIKEIAKEITTIQSLNKRCKKNLMHIVLSFPQHEKLNNLKIKKITEDFLEAFNAKDFMSISYKHFDRDHPHVHCVINKIKNDGTVLSDSFSHIRAKKICRKIEQIYDLHRVSNYKHENENKAIIELRNEIDNAINYSKSMDDFIRLLLLKKYKVKTGRGVVFINNKNGTKIKGSAIGRNYSLSNIIKQIQTDRQREVKDIQNIMALKPNTMNKNKGIQF